MKLAAIDLGASGGRLLLGTLDGDSSPVLRLEEIHRFDHGPVYLPHQRGGTFHWDAPGLWVEILEGLRKLRQAHGRPDSIGVDTWGVDFALLDERGALLENPVSYRDPRTEGMVEKAWERVPREELFRRTGIQFMRFNSAFQLMAAAEQESHLLSLARTFLMMPDLFHYWLCGERAVEFTNASTTQMVGPESRDWDRDLLQQLAVRHDFLPGIVEAGTRLGPLRPAVAEEAGLPSDVPVICPATHDTASAVVATPGEGTDWAFLSAGTWCLFGAELPRPYLEPEVLEAGFGNEGGVNGTTRLLRNITGLWLVQECRRYWHSQGKDYSYGELAQAAADSPPFVAFVDPDASDFAQPTRMPEAIAEYCRRTGQPAPSTVGEYVRVSLEGIALTVRHRWRQLEGILGRRLGVLHIVGGGTQNRLLCRFVANAIGQPVLAGPTEATAMGNALVQAVGHGILNYAEARAVVRRSSEVTEYRPEAGGRWDDAYAGWLCRTQGGSP
jgi:rhamnulokinase